MNENIIKKIEELKQCKNLNIMEVCGTHTMAISRFGIRDILKENMNLISGPGCPVCVTPDCYIDYIYELSLKKDVIITTYGDMIRVPGSFPYINLEKAKAKGANVKMVYSSIDALNIAQNNPDKKVVFMGIGFETTTPATAAAVIEAKEINIKNFYVLSVHKIVEPVMRLLLEDKEVKIDGFLCPGHVAVITGEKGFEFLNEYTCPGVITGFELNEIVDALYILSKQIENKNGGVINAYGRLVRYQGNIAAVNLINKVFETSDDIWRGMGVIKNSGLKLKGEYSDFDIEKIYPVNYKTNEERNGCMCGEVLKGKISPIKCPLFKKVCCPENPVGPCMVSSEGSCAAYYRYL